MDAALQSPVTLVSVPRAYAAPASKWECVDDVTMPRYNSPKPADADRALRLLSLRSGPPQRQLLPGGGR